MKFTLNWLKKHLDTNASAAEIAAALNNIGFEVESITDMGKIYSPFIVAQIEDAKRHPNAEKLQVCTVNNGQEKLQIVCGAPNARAGIKVVLAPVGTHIPGSDIIIKASKIRDVESHGMLCSGAELQLSTDSDGILELPDDSPIGYPFAQLFDLDDQLIEISITPNRGDGASVYGLARDLAATGIGTLKAWTPNSLLLGEAQDIITNNATEDCYQFALTKITSVNNNKQSHFRSTLRKLGSSDKTALVDISNYLMLSYGRPNHIYDADKIDGNLTVRYSLEGEQFVALGGENFKLPEGLLVIADNTKICAIAGVMGGELSKVDEATTNILVEVASFSPEAVMKSGRALNLNSDSRYRFERKVDLANTEKFNLELCAAIIEECGGRVICSSRADGKLPNLISELEFDFNYTKKLAGFEIDLTTQHNILTSLGFEINQNQLKIPSYRQGDIAGKQDIVEEILRIYGLNRISSNPSSGSLKLTEHPLDRTRKRLAHSGLNEVYSWSFYSRSRHQLFGFESGAEIDNPISNDLAIMRRTMLATIIDAADLNARRSVATSAFFEIGKIYHSLDSEENVISGLRYGEGQGASAHGKSRKVDFYDAKADAFAAIEELGFDPSKLQYKQSAPSYYHPGRSCTLLLGNKVICYLGELHPLVTSELDLKDKLVGFELFYENLPQSRVKHARSKLVRSEYQPVDRDFAFVVERDVDAAELLKTARSCSKLIAECNIFDQFIDDKLGNNKKSLAFRVRIQPQVNTLTEEEVNTISNDIIRSISTKLGGELRA